MNKLAIVAGIGILGFGMYNFLQFNKAKKLKKNKIYNFAPIQYSDGSSANSLLKAHNEFRSQVGLKPLKAGANITKLAYRRNMEGIRKNLLTHSGVEDEFSELIGLGADAVGENIAFGYGTATGVFDAWIFSPDHHKNIVNKNYDYCGISVVTAPNNRKWYCVLFVNEKDL